MNEMVFWFQILMSILKGMSNKLFWCSYTFYPCDNVWLIYDIMCFHVGSYETRRTYLLLRISSKWHAHLVLKQFFPKTRNRPVLTVRNGLARVSTSHKCNKDLRIFSWRQCGDWFGQEAKYQLEDICTFFD